jgi:CxxC motif-containing protein (DUF1111 family)
MHPQTSAVAQIRARPISYAAWGLVLSAVLGLAACGGGGGGDGGGSSAAPVADNNPLLEPGFDAAPAPAVDLGLVPSGSESGSVTIPARPVDMSNPGKAAKSVLVTASGSDGNHPAAHAVDGDLTTRWAGNNADSAWIQFDFGQKTQIGYMLLVWEAAYAKAYTVQTSDDGVTWVDIRKVTAGTGGTEELYNLGADARYIRLQGVTRGTQYAYSLFEVTFKTPGSDNSIAARSVAALPIVANGVAYVPMLPATQEPLESVQFALPDGTLVTRFGLVGRGRHARERGEEWNEIGYGVNETVNAAGNAVDKGPGNYLSFVPNYFKNRTWGTEFIDNSNVAGVTKPKLVVNQYFQQAQKGGGHSFFRRFDSTGVTGYGWMSPGDLLDDSTYTAGFGDVAACPVVQKPANGTLLKPSSGYSGIIGANDGCSVVLDSYPNHTEILPDANGVLAPIGKNVAARSLKLGDVMEFTGSFFSSTAAMAAIGDTGNKRYYTTEVTYVMGKGLRPWYGVQPRLMNAPLPDETLQGGVGSVSYDYADNGSFMFQQQQNNIGMQNMQRFVEGRQLIHTNMLTGEHTEAGNDRYLPALGLLGQRFNQTNCFACHVGNGRSPAPTALNQRLDTMGVRTAMLDANGKQVPHPRYGTEVQMNGLSQSLAPQDWGNSVRVKEFRTQTLALADGTAVELRQPVLAFDGPVPAVVSLRAAQPLIGGGLLEAVPEADILARVRTTPDADGVLGTANFVFDPETGNVRLGRFGWKAGKFSLRHQTAAALAGDMSVTSPLYPNRSCLADPVNCKTATSEKGITEAELQKITQYLQLLAVPAQRSLTSGFPKGVAPLSDLDVNPVQVAAGAKIFNDTLRCTACHAAEMKTGKGHLMDELRNQTIRPYTDLLLHDMGAGLADNYAEGQAAGNLWRTSPLWGIGYTARVMGDASKVGYLHDGRARTLTEAVMWHGGEALASRNRFAALPTADRQALLAFLRSL